MSWPEAFVAATAIVCVCTLYGWLAWIANKD